MKYNPDFIVVPFDILSDDRLTLRQIRVLMAILSWRKKNTNLSAISREMIAERTGYPLSRISTITSELESLGWLKKQGNGGRSKWIRYQINDLELDKDIPTNDYQNSNCLNDKERVTETVTVTKSETVTDSDLNGYQNSNETVTESGTRIDTNRITDKDTDKKINKKESTSSKKSALKKQTTISIDDLKNQDVDEQVAIEFIELRKQKRAKLSPLALAGIQREADKAGMPLNDVLRMCIERGWQGFDASWIEKNKITKSDRHHQEAVQIQAMGRWADEQLRKENQGALP